MAVSLSPTVPEDEMPDPEIVEQCLRDLFAKAGSAKMLLETAGISAEEAIPHLVSGWNRVAQGVTWFLSGLQRVSSKQRGTWRGRLAGASDACARWQDALAPLLEGYVAGPPDRDPPVALEVCVSDLFEAAGTLRDFRGAVHPRSIKRPTKRQLMILLGVAALCGLIGTAGVLLSEGRGARGGLTAKYCNFKPKKGPCVERRDPTVNFNWKNKSPARGIKPDFFTAEWHGCLFVDKEVGPHLITGADDGIVVMVDKKIIIDTYGNGPYRMGRSQYPIAPGVHELDVFYREANFNARVFLGWSFEGRRPVPIPQKNLVPLGGNGTHRCPDKPARLKRQP